MEKSSVFSANCLFCRIGITNDVKAYSAKKYGVYLCRKCQSKHDSFKDETTPQVIKLFKGLCEANVPSELEYYDDFKRVDIHVKDAKLDIEIDGMQHYLNLQQGISDLQRTVYSYKSERMCYTLRIPNKLIDEKFEDTLKWVIMFIEERVKRITRLKIVYKNKSR